MTATPHSRRLATLSSAPDEEWAGFLDDLHRLAGTAGFFGDAALGDAAGALEHDLPKAQLAARPALLMKFVRMLETA